VATARAEMDRLVTLGGLQSDPLRYPIEALSVHLDALNKVCQAFPAEGRGQQISEDDVRRIADLAVARCVEELRHTTDELKETVVRDIRAGGFREITGAADRLVRQRNKHFAIWSGAAVMAALIIGGAIVWRWQPTLQCTPQQNGGIYCGYWLTPKTKQ
jgi:hypothetical protein